MSDALRTHMMRHANPPRSARGDQEGMLTMYEDGLRKAVAGVTTFEEVLRVTRED